jgi:hypothetical protein
MMKYNFHFLLSLPSCSVPRLTVKLHPRDENYVNDDIDDDDDDNDKDDDYDQDDYEQDPSSEAESNWSNFSPTFHTDPF